MTHLRSKGNEMNIVKTHTGKIYVDSDKQLEFLTVGDYGKENNIKADFLGLTKEINGVENTEVDLTKKWVATISTQKGCPMKCKFCDCPKYGYHGNATTEELAYEIDTILQNEDVKHTERFNVHFARMGEPTFNENVLYFTRNILRPLVYSRLTDGIGTILQFSINSTNEAQRQDQFNGMSLSLSEISNIAKLLPMPKGKKYTLNFAVTAQTILDAKVLSSLFDKDKFIVKITPIHETNSAITNGF